MPALTDEEKERVRYHTGYMETSFAASMQLGIPRPVQTIFLLEQALGLLSNQYAVDRVRRTLATLDDLECQLTAAAKMVGVESLGSIKMHPLAGQGKLVTDSLEKEYVRWARRLADIFGVPLYPYSWRFRVGGPGHSIPVV